MREIWTNASGEIILMYKNGVSWYSCGGGFDFATAEKNDAVFVLTSLGFKRSLQ